ncbi:Regulator of RNase E activity RraA [Arthrobacter alpinus]|uniref:Putative 4-hydroxy-4-methyl-2-oxoglutarate aldolase n=1 Tax=Arthrobacter alpinus TaxID=656366 RepID=A0A1H5PGM4_9MICC|nr:RraA family protein [Arthrobacter alpinus]SEF12221.1 Regulator of RNase E activity RraA [Arthrobacter alpinus]
MSASTSHTTPPATVSNEEALARLKALDTASLSDAMDSLEVPCVLSGIQAQVPGATVAGIAFTVTYRPINPAVTGFRNAANYIDDVPPGAVIVVDNGGSTECTTWGGLLTSVARRREIAGTVIHGSARDVREIREHNYPLFSTAVHMVSGKNRVELASTGEDVLIGAVRVQAGDFVVADDNGAIVIPHNNVIEVITRAEQVERTEELISLASDSGLRLDEARRQFRYDRPWDGPDRPQS